MNAVALFLGLLLCSGAYAQPLRLIHRYYDEEELLLKARYHIRDNDSILIEGLYEEFRIDGQLRASGSFSQGKKEGSFTTYHPNGTEASVIEYQNGAKNGSVEVFFPDGQLRQESNFENGLLDGEVCLYYPGGKLERVAYFESDLIEKTILEYYPNGALKREMPQLHSKPHGTLLIYYENGQLKSQHQYQNGKPSGTTEHYYPDGQLRTRFHYKNGIPEGLMEVYHENGQLSYKGRFREGVAEKIFTSYSADGQLLQETQPSGFSARKSTRYHSNGAIAREYIFSKNEDQHTHIQYDEAGRLRTIESYQDGLPEGNWELHDPDLHKKTVEKYTEGALSLRQYYRKEQLYREEVFSDQESEYQDIHYHDNGAVSEIHTYLKKRRTGPYVAYFKNGKKKTEGYYLHDHPVGKWVYYDQKGTLIETKTYDTERRP